MLQEETNLYPVEKSKKANIIIPFLSVALLIMVVLAGYFYWQNIQIKKNPQFLAEQEVKSIVAKVSRLILLPEDEIPTIAIVTDTNILKGQEFFAKAQKGDQVLVYKNAGKAILYRPTSNIIVNVAPININDTPAITPIPYSTTKQTTHPSAEKKP